MAEWYESSPLATQDPEKIEVPDEIKDQADRIRDAHYYNQQFGIPADQAFDLQPELNEFAFGNARLAAAPGKLFVDSFKQSLAEKPAMILHGITAYTPGKALGLDPLLDKASTYLQSLKDPDVTTRLDAAKQGKSWPTGDERAWWQVEAKYLPEVINTWSANIGDQIPIMLITKAGQLAGAAIGKPVGAVVAGGVALVTGGLDPSDVATAPAIVATTQAVTKHLVPAGLLVGMEAGGFLDAANEIKGANRPADPDLAEKYGRLYGAGSGAIEYAQWLWVLGRYSKIAKKAQEGILKTVLTHIGGSAFEGLEEYSQTSLQNWLIGKMVAEMKTRYPDYTGEAPEITQGAKRDGWIAAGVSGLTGLPGTGMSVTEAALARRRQVKPEMKKFLDEPSVAEMEAQDEEAGRTLAAGTQEAAPGSEEVQRAVPEAVVAGAEAVVAPEAAGAAEGVKPTVKESLTVPATEQAGGKVNRPEWAPDKLAYHEETGKPGLSVEQPYAGDEVFGRHRIIVYRDENGKALGTIEFRVKDDGTLEDRVFEDTKDSMNPIEVFVDPKYRRKGIATAMWQFAKQQGYDFNALKGQLYTEEGEAFAKPGGKQVQTVGVSEQVPTKAEAVPAPAETGVQWAGTVYRGIGKGGPTDYGFFGKGTYYTTEPRYAEMYGEVTSHTVILKNPFVIKTAEEALKFQNEAFRGNVRKQLEETGYDSIVVTKEALGEPGKPSRRDEIVLFHPEIQAKATLPSPKTAEIVPPAKRGEAEKASEAEGVATPPPTLPAPPGMAELPPFGNAKAKLIEQLKKARRIISQIKGEQHEERKRRVGKAAGTKEYLISKGVPAREAVLRSKRALAGPLTTYEQRYESIREAVGEEAVESLHRTIALDSKLQYHEGDKLGEVLDKLLDGTALTLHEARLLGNYFGKEVGNAATARVPIGDRFWFLLMEGLNIPRTSLASIDQSGILRQGRMLMQAHPEFAKEFVTNYAKAFANEDFAQKAEADYKKDPLYDEAKWVGLELPEWGRVDVDITELEERFAAARLLQWVPGVRASERSFVVALNWLRLAAYSKLVNATEMARGQEMTLAEKKHLASTINNLSGRTTLPQGLKQLSPILNAFFFSPRFAVSRFMLPKDVIMGGVRSLAEVLPSEKGKWPTIRQRTELQPELVLAIKATASMLATNLAIMALIAFVSGDDDDLEMETDPRSTGFGYIRHKKQHIDLWAGYVQAARFLSRFATGQIKTASGEVREINRWDVFRDFVQSKEAPLAAVILDWWRGENMMGKPFWEPEKGSWLEKTWLPTEITGGLKEVWDRLTPLVIQDTVDALTVEGIPEAMTAGPLAWFGAGVQTYEPSGFTVAKEKKNELAEKAYNQKWDNLKPSEQAKLRAKHDEIQELERAAKKESYPLTNMDLTEQANSNRRIHESLSGPVQEAINEGVVTVGVSRKVFSDFFLNDKRYQVYEKMASAEIEDRVARRIANRNWSKIPPNKQAEILHDDVNKAREFARQKLKAQIERGKL